ncbi:MAG: hypothetical protein L0Y72_32225 [Gemmataceae bacterium]|nr:hypothetical protein [Gemmataceae bacterium]MCI0743723.1 hypothetical protein [Gemmataceae bacterium]
MKLQTAWLAALTAVLAPAALCAGETAKVDSVSGGLFAKSAGQSWRALKAGDAVKTGVHLVAMPHSEIASANDAVQIVLFADIGQRGPLAVLESGLSLNEAKDADIDFTLERGLVVVASKKKAGAAKVRVRVASESWLFTLHDPGTKVGIEVFGRVPAGIPADLATIGPPLVEVVGIVIAREAFLDQGTMGVGLKAPPGQAFFHWDSAEKKLAVRRMDKLPGSLIKPFDDRQSKLFKEVCAACSHVLHEKGVAAWLRELTEGDNKAQRLTGVTLAGALDELPVVHDVLESSKHADARAHAILVMRHWLGREPGQVQKFYDTLTKKKGLSDVQARSAVQLLIGFDEEEKGRPETYDLLIHYLRHSKQAVRELAHWHLVRLVAKGKDIPYDAAAPEAERQKSYERWRAHIPEGKLPPESTLKKKAP